ncbi:MAG: YceI family protein, partial [Candidatus Dormibacteraeota bacterium]|nr:YceI family protein [Candidatus Dormibacteraeota bacterium]
TTNNEQRDAHLKSGDFFESEGHPQAVYRPTRAERTGSDTFKVYGDLTIRSVTKELVLDVTVADEIDHPFQPGSKIVAVEATGSLNRKDFGLNWDGLAGTIPLASNEIKLEIDAELVRTAQTADAATA